MVDYKVILFIYYELLGQSIFSYISFNKFPFSKNYSVLSKYVITYLTNVSVIHCISRSVVMCPREKNLKEVRLLLIQSLEVSFLMLGSCEAQQFTPKHYGKRIKGI